MWLKLHFFISKIEKLNNSFQTRFHNTVFNTPAEIIHALNYNHNKVTIFHLFLKTYLSFLKIIKFTQLKLEYNMWNYLWKIKCFDAFQIEFTILINLRDWELLIKRLAKVKNINWYLVYTLYIVHYVQFWSSSNWLNFVAQCQCILWIDLSMNFVKYYLKHNIKYD